MSGDKDPARGEVKASVPLVVRRVTKKHTSRVGCQLVRSSGGDVRVTGTPEDTKVVVARRGTEKSVVWSGSRESRGRKAVEQVGGGVDSHPRSGEAERPGSEGCACRRSSCESSTSLAVLERGIRTRHAQLNTPGEEERTGGGVVKL